MVSHGSLRKSVMTASSLIFRRHVETALRRHFSVCGVKLSASHHAPAIGPYNRVDIGKREVVGYGMNGEEVYIDDINAPFPAIRFREDTPEILKLKEKEKGDWKKLTIDERKQLYRASFCQTLSEMMAPTGEWKTVLGIAFFWLGCSVWVYILLKKFVYGPLPETMTDEDRLRKQLKTLIDMRVNPVDGLASKYDYEKMDWKK